MTSVAKRKHQPIVDKGNHDANVETKPLLLDFCLQEGVLEIEINHSNIIYKLIIQ